jgi:uncharacterized damage-inducible protein DinB
MATAAAPTAEFATLYTGAQLTNLEQEISTTMKVIAAVPEGKRDYRPDPKARTAWELAWHIASEDVVLLDQICEGNFHLPDPRYDAQKPATARELAEWYQARMKEAIAKVRKLTPEQLMTPVDFLGMMKAPLFVYVTLMLHHSIHHRGQLSTYLRPMGGKVPGIYGPSADQPL